MCPLTCRMAFSTAKRLMKRSEQMVTRDMNAPPMVAIRNLRRELLLAGVPGGAEEPNEPEEPDGAEEQGKLEDNVVDSENNLNNPDEGSREESGDVGNSSSMSTRASGGAKSSPISMQSLTAMGSGDRAG